MFEGVDVKELLGAYLAGDIRPEERVAVERLLSQDPATRDILEGLREASATANSAQRPVSEKLSRLLHDRLAQLLADESTSAALGSALAGELSAAERETLKRFLREHPRAKSELSLMKSTGAWLKQKNPVISDAAVETLRQRLNSKLPAHAQVKTRISDDVSRETTMVKTPVLPANLMRPASAMAPTKIRETEKETERISLRVVAPYNPWMRRAGWVAAAAAASVAMAFGIARIFAPGETQLVKNKGETPVVPHETVRPEEQLPIDTQNAPLVRNETITPVTPTPLPPQETPRAPDAVITQNTPPTPGTKNGIAQPNETAPQPRVAETPRPRVIPQSERETIERVAPENKTVAQESKKPDTAPVTQNPLDVPAPNNTGVAVNETAPRNTQGIPYAPGNTNNTVANAPNTSGTAVVPPKPPADNDGGIGPGTAVADGGAKTGNGLNGENNFNTPGTNNDGGVKTATNETPRDAMAVASVKGGNVEARPKTGAAQTLSSAQAGIQLPSETEFITTSTSRIALELPEGGKLWLNINTRAKVKLSGSSTTVELSGGQIAYETARGSLTVVSGEVSVTAAKNVDVRIDNNTLIAAVLGERASVKGKNVQKGQQGSVALTGTEAVKVGPIEGNVSLWREGLELGRTTTGDAKPKAKAKAARNRRS
jgi:anti-sigma factor RsiW